MVIYELTDCIITNFDDLEKNIDYIKRLVRHSKEYKRWVGYQRQMLGMNYSPEYDENFSDYNLSLEIHHIVYLESIVSIVGASMIAELEAKEYLLPMDIAKEVIDIHLADEVLTVGLSTTLHERLHAGLETLDEYDKAMIHIGNVQSFINQYKQFFPDNVKETYDKYVKGDE